jgi:hypothetical protein
MFSRPSTIESPSRGPVETATLNTVEGTMKRVDYRKREFSIVAGQQVAYFSLDSESRLWFDDQPAVLRCFHPLDRVKIVFLERNSVAVIKAMYAWEKQSL